METSSLNSGSKGNEQVQKNLGNTTAKNEETDVCLSYDDEEQAATAVIGVNTKMNTPATEDNQHHNLSDISQSSGSSTNSSMDGSISISNDDNLSLDEEANNNNINITTNANHHPTEIQVQRSTSSSIAGGGGASHTTEEDDIQGSSHTGSRNASSASTSAASSSHPTQKQKPGLHLLNQMPSSASAASSSMSSRRRRNENLNNLIENRHGHHGSHSAHHHNMHASSSAHHPNHGFGANFFYQQHRSQFTSSSQRSYHSRENAELNRQRGRQGSCDNTDPKSASNASSSEDNSAKVKNWLRLRPHERKPSLHSLAYAARNRAYGQSTQYPHAPMYVMPEDQYQSHGSFQQQQQQQSFGEGDVHGSFQQQHSMQYMGGPAAPAIGADGNVMSPQQQQQQQQQQHYHPSQQQQYYHQYAHPNQTMSNFQQHDQAEKGDAMPNNYSHHSIDLAVDEMQQISSSGSQPKHNDSTGNSNNDVTIPKSSSIDSEGQEEVVEVEEGQRESNDPGNTSNPIATSENNDDPPPPSSHEPEYVVIKKDAGPDISLDDDLPDQTLSTEGLEDNNPDQLHQNINNGVSTHTDDDDEDNLHRASPDSKYESYGCRIDRGQEDRSTEIALFSFDRPHMRAFHFAWISFFVAFFTWFAITPLQAEIKDTLNLSHEQLWTSSICGIAGTIVCRMIAGPICDSYGARWVMSITLIISCLPVMATGLVHTMIELSFLRLLTGIAGSAFVTCQYWTSTMFTREVAGTANSLVAGWGNVGGAVSQVFIGSAMFPLFKWMYGERDDNDPEGEIAERAWRSVFVIPAIPCIICAYCLIRYSDDSPKGNYRKLKRLGYMPDVNVKKSFLSACYDRNTWILFVHYASCFGVELMITNAAAIYFIEEFDQSTEVGAAIASIFGWMNLFARGFGGYMSDMMNVKMGMKGRLLWQAIALIAEGCLLIVFGSTRSIGGSIAAMAACSLFVQSAEGATFSMVPYVRPRVTGSVAGIVAAGGNVGGVTFLVFIRQWGYRRAYTMVGICVICSAALIFFVSIRGHANFLCGRDAPEIENRIKNRSEVLASFTTGERTGRTVTEDQQQLVCE